MGDGKKEEIDSAAKDKFVGKILLGTGSTGGHDDDAEKKKYQTKYENADESTDFPFPSSMDNFKAKKDYYHSKYIASENLRCYTFGEGKHKFRLDVTTLECFLSSKDGHLREVDLTLPEDDLQYLQSRLEGRSRQEILDIFASARNSDRARHYKLINALKQNDIEHIVNPLTKNIFVKNCDWNTLLKISNLVAELQCHLTVSGGGPGEYFVNPEVRLPSVYQSLRTGNYQKLIAVSGMTNEDKRNTTIGIIDSGCSLRLYEEVTIKGNVVLFNSMIEAVDPTSPTVVPYYDCYSRQNGEALGHGTGVVEIIANCVVPNTKIVVANIGDPFDGSNVECAMTKLFQLGVEIINCSIGVKSNSINLRRTMTILKSVGVIIVAAAGNTGRNYVDFNNSALDDGGTIMVGSHNDRYLISSFSVGKCRVSICSRGEDVYLKHVTPHVQNGTSFATPHVTAVIANFLSHQHSQMPNETLLKAYFRLSAGDLTCDCISHHGEQFKLRLRPFCFMDYRRGPPVNNTESKRSTWCSII